MKKNEIAEEEFEDILYTKKPRENKKTITKKIGKKQLKKTQNKKKCCQKTKDISCMKGADTLITTAENTNTEKLDKQNMGADTLNVSVKKKKSNKTEWIKPNRKPSEKETRKMFGKALQIMLNLCMSNHLYQFENEYRKQKKGGPIGLKLTGEIADCLMLDWDKKLLEKLKNLKMKPEVYTRFKDDIEIVIESLEKGSKLNENDKIIIDENKKVIDEEKSGSKVTMEIIQQIANSVNPMIRLTVETPCNFKDGMLPVLEIKVRINEIEMNRIDFEYYEKPTKNPRVVLASSALSQSKKRTILTQEGLRRLRNTKKELGQEVQTK